VKSQQRRWPHDDGDFVDPATGEKQTATTSPGALDQTCGEIGCATPRPVDDQELLLHESAVGDNRSCTTGSQELGDSPQQMGDEDEQVSHDDIE